MLFLIQNLLINFNINANFNIQYTIRKFQYSILYTNFNTKSINFNTNRINTLILIHRALKICSKFTLKHELDNICPILVKNGYSGFLIDLRISKKLFRFQQNTKEGPKKCLVYLKLPWIGENSLKFERKIKSLITNRLGASNHEWSFPPNVFYLQYIRTFFPLFNKVMSHMNNCVTAIIGMWVKSPNVCRTESASMCQSLFGTEPVKNKNNQNTQVNQLILYCIVTRRLQIIYCTTRNVHLTIRTINFLFFSTHDPNSIYQS